MCCVCRSQYCRVVEFDVAFVVVVVGFLLPSLFHTGIIDFMCVVEFNTQYAFVNM